VLATDDGAYLFLWSCFNVKAYYALTETAPDILPHNRILKSRKPVSGVFLATGYEYRNRRSFSGRGRVYVAHHI